MADAKKVDARVLVDCEHGKPNAVVSLDADVAKAAEKAGVIDTAKEAVAYAKSIASEAPRSGDVKE